MLMQNFGATNKEHYGMLWYFQEWPILLFSVHIPGGGGGGTQQIYIRGGSTRMSNPLPFLDTIFHKKGTPFTYLI